MKRTLVVLAIVLALQACSARLSAEDRQIQESTSECITQTGADKEDSFGRFVTGDPDDQDKLMADNSNLKRFFVCFYTKMGLINADGEIQKEALKKRFGGKSSADADKVDKAVDKCAVQKDAAWKTTIEMMKCMQKELSG